MDFIEVFETFAEKLLKVLPLSPFQLFIDNFSSLPYDFTPFHLIYEDKNTEGFAASCANVDQSILDAIPMPKVNDEIEIFCHFYNGSMTVDGIL